MIEAIFSSISLRSKGFRFYVRSPCTVLVRCYPTYEPTITVRPMGGDTNANAQLLGDRISDDAIRLSWNVAAGASAKGTLDCVPSWLTDFRDDLPRIDVPTLIVQGDADRILPHHSTGARLLIANKPQN